MSTRSKTNSALMEARKSKLERFYEKSLFIDDKTKHNNHALLGTVRLYLEDKANEVTEDPEFAPFLQFVKQILVHLMSGSQSWVGTVVNFGYVVRTIAASDVGRQAWIDSHPESQGPEDLTPYIVSYIRDSPPAIVLVDTQEHESRNRRHAIKEYSWGFVCKGVDDREDNEMFFSRELVAAYIDLEKAKADSPSSDQLTIVQSVIMIAFLHELTHTITKSLFRGLITPDMNGGQQGEAGEALERLIFGGIMCVEWLRRDFENRDLRMKRIQNLYIMRVLPNLDQEAQQDSSNEWMPRAPTGKTCFYKLEIKDLKIMLDSLDRIQIYSPAYVPDQNGIADCDAGPADGKSYVRLRVMSEARTLEVDLKSASPPSKVVGLGLDSIIAFPTKDRIVVGKD
ncbi:uncharacterized protein EV420DRAFT_382176 [Desarmillaria tabescens]|uniref:Uncharacterized protein n=1 Tax=Armillaria tabescens TaxID=1929756 RepID=A0AA39KBK7_ARMTA|nr:uncharacterized protein EV420DRAFT_382176 [Desarmillaria tabescens]KAK0458151.1 hypothetical protein EV420DRAFT_382176 [Desarmillaria tabescens]